MDQGAELGRDYTNIRRYEGVWPTEKIRLGTVWDLETMDHFEAQGVTLSVWTAERFANAAEANLANVESFLVAHR